MTNVKKFGAAAISLAACLAATATVTSANEKNPLLKDDNAAILMPSELPADNVVIHSPSQQHTEKNLSDGQPTYASESKVSKKRPLE